MFLLHVETRFKNDRRQEKYHEKSDEMIGKVCRVFFNVHRFQDKPSCDPDKCSETGLLQISMSLLL